jgi:nucleoside-diphosphate-sugar epimerase
MKIFVTGGSGYIGSAVALRLKKAGHAVTALVRSPEKAKDLAAAGIKLAKGDLSNPASYAATAYGSDAVVHTAIDYGPESVELDKKTLQTARELLRGRVGATLIYTSGIWVLGPTEGETPVDESAALKPAKIAAWRAPHEQLALEAQKDGIRAVVVRPGIVYGGARGGIPAGFFGTAMKSGAAQVVGDGSNVWPMVHIDDLAELYVRAVERAPAGSIFFAVDGSQHTAQQVAEAAAKAAGKDGQVQTLSLDQARQSLGAPYAEALALSQRISGEKARNELDWRPRHESFVNEAAQLFAAWRASQ